MRDDRLLQFFRRNRSVLIHWTVFLLIIAFLLAVDEWANRWINGDYAAFTAQISAAILNLLGFDASARGVSFKCSMCTFVVIGECTAYYPTAIFIAAVLSFPTRSSRKLIGIVIGLPALLLINQARLLTLCWVHDNYPDLFETIHVLVWQSLIIFFTVLLWIFWVSTVAVNDEAPSA
jgi:exosortase/archaeosortase family protein